MAFCSSSCSAFFSSAAVLFALISSEREAHGRFPKDVFNVFGKDYFFVNQQLCQPVVPFLVFGQYFLGTFVLFVDHLLHFFVNQFRSLFAIRAVEGIFLIIIVTEVGEFFRSYPDRQSYRTPAWSRVPSHSWLRWIFYLRIGLRQHVLPRWHTSHRASVP